VRCPSRLEHRAWPQDSAHARRMCPGLWRRQKKQAFCGGEGLSAAAGDRVDTPEREGGAHVRGIAYRESGSREARGIGEAAASAHARGWKCFVACLALRRVPCSRGLSLTRACVFSVRRPATARASDERLREPGQRPGATRGPPCCEEDEASSCSPQSVPCGQAWRLLRSPCRRRLAPS
jgi:hypothetical protein